MRRLVFLVPLIVFAVLAVWMAVPMLQARDPSDLPSALLDRPAPETDLPPVMGRAAGVAGLTTADLATGEPILLNVFASWCAPCLAEHPLLTSLADEGITIHAINYRDDPADAAAWLAQHGDPFDRVGLDREGRAGIDWGITGVPETFVIDGEGRIRYRFAGPLTPAIVDRDFRPLLASLAQ
ncbi:MAG: DsbE family thiol:disulfide interchange protein [Pseudomonadota bacterium]